MLSDHPLAERLHRLRHEAGITQYELAKDAGVRPEVVSRIENGKVTDPPISTVIGLAGAFTRRLARQVTVGYLIGVENGEAAEQMPSKVAG